jgi:hypothetical protein
MSEPSAANQNRGAVATGSVFIAYSFLLQRPGRYRSSVLICSAVLLALFSLDFLCKDHIGHIGQPFVFSS